MIEARAILSTAEIMSAVVDPEKMRRASVLQQRFGQVATREVAQTQPTGLPLVEHQILLQTEAMKVR